MKTSEEYLKNSPINFTSKAIEDKFISIIKQAQKDAWNEAIDECVDNFELKYEDPHPLQYCDCYETSFDEQSLLKLKIQ